MKNKTIPVIDFSEFPAPNTRDFILMPEDENETFDICTEFIQLATAVPSGTVIESDIYCPREMDDGELCEGSVDVKRIDIPSQVRWKCRKCGDEGAIINFEDTVWDNSGLTEAEKNAFLEDFYASLSEEDLFEGDLYDFNAFDSGDPLEDFTYYLNPYDPDAVHKGGLPSARIEEMINCDWTDPGSPIYLRDDLSAEELQHSFFFRNARQFLLMLKKQGSFELTRSGYLKRNVVRRLQEQFWWPESLDSPSPTQHSPDEIDNLYVYGIRILLDFSGLIEHRNNEYRINPDLLHLVKEEHAGQLYRRLFSTYFKDTDLGFPGNICDFPHLQHSVPFILYQLKNLAASKVPVEDLLPDILLFSVGVELDMADPDDNMPSLVRDFLYENLFFALELFGLLETYVTGDPDGFPYSPGIIKITPLFDTFIVFSD